jgi:hypothetical protein
MSWSGLHDGCPLHGHATDAVAARKHGCLCRDLETLQGKSEAEAGRVEYAKANPKERRYAICTKAINMTCLSIELERLRRVGVPQTVIDQWHKRTHDLLTEILSYSDALKRSTTDRGDL